MNSGSKRGSPRLVELHQVQALCEPVRAEDYEELHREFAQHTYATLWSVVHEFDKE